MKPFSQWTIEEVEDVFHIVMQSESTLLQQWMTCQRTPNEEEQRILTMLCAKLQQRAWDWNEDELKVCFIAPLLHLIDFEQVAYKPFFSREIAVTYQHEKLWGQVDFVVAAGRRSPKRHYFFIHEYKREHDASNDPLGQLMIAMVAAQTINDDSNPVYGAYVMGRYWHFTLLHGASYSVHMGLNATDEDDVRTIFGVLHNTKQIIDGLAHAPAP